MIRLAFIFLIISIQLIKGQTRLKDTIPKTKFNFGFCDYYQTPFKGNALVESIKKPSNSSVFLQRRWSEPKLQKRWNLNNEYSTDNPIRHEAFMLDFHLAADITKDLKLEGRVVFEDRGLSYGAYNPNLFVFYPQYKLLYRKNFVLHNHIANFRYEIGNFVNFKFGEGLVLYNIDFQGDYAQLKYRNFTLENIHIYDLSTNIGLNIDDADQLGLFFSPFTTDTTRLLRYRFGIINSINLPTPERPFTTKKSGSVDITAAIFHSNKFRIYSQGSYRYAGFGKNVPGKFALLVGFEAHYLDNNNSFAFKTEGRYYGQYYNFWYYNIDVYYRDTSQNDLGNFVGTSIYPLERYDRPFSQWAVFTTYQFTSVAAISLQGDYSYRIWKGFNLLIKPDLNFIFWPKTVNYFAPFFQAGILYETKNFDTYIGITNKGMNLDNWYPDFYLYKTPVFFVRLRKLLEHESFIVNYGR
jgi:hypothetical protein